MSDASSPRSGRTAVLIATILASSLGFIDGSVLPVAIPAIRSSLHAGFGEAQWIVNAYMLLLSSLILVGGAAGDLFGQRETFAGGIVVFCAASIGCALAASPDQLIALRAVQGAGAAFMIPGSLALIARSYEAKERGQAIGIWSMASGIASALGPILGGFLIETGGAEAWRYVFWLNLPFGIAALGLLYAFAPRFAVRPNGSLDLLGALLITIGFGGLALGLTYAADPQPGAIRITLAFVIGVVALALFWWWEGRTKAPMLPRFLFSLPVFNGANLLTFFLYFSLAGALFFLPTTLIEALKLPAVYAGSVFLPFTVTMAIVGAYAGRLTDSIGPRTPLTLGALITGISFLGLGISAALHAFWLGVLPSMAVMGIGMGLVVSPLSTTVMTATDDELVGTASGVNNGVARLAGLFAVAGLGVVASLAYRLGIDPTLVPGGYGELLHNATTQADDMRTSALIHAFLAVLCCTAVLTFISAGIGWRMLPANIPNGNKRKSR